MVNKVSGIGPKASIYMTCTSSLNIFIHRGRP
jgi:hypothetical protein